MLWLKPLIICDLINGINPISNYFLSVKSINICDSDNYCFKI